MFPPPLTRCLSNKNVQYLNYITSAKCCEALSCVRCICCMMQVYWRHILACYRWTSNCDCSHFNTYWWHRSCHQYVEPALPVSLLFHLIHRSTLLQAQGQRLLNGHTLHDCLLMCFHSDSACNFAWVIWIISWGPLTVLSPLNLSDMWRVSMQNVFHNMYIWNAIYYIHKCIHKCIHNYYRLDSVFQRLTLQNINNLLCKGVTLTEQLVYI